MIALILIGWFGMSDARGAQVSGPAATPAALARFEYAETHMGSTFNLILYSTAEAIARDASRAAFRRIADLDAILSDYQPESELSRLSARAGGPPVAVSPDLFDVLDRAKRLWERSDGAFDVTMAPVGRLWRRARRDHRLPDPALLRRARGLVGSNHLHLDPVGRTARLELPGMKLDAGGIAKGYAAQAAIDVLKARGITRALAAGAGDIVVGDAPPGAAGWTVEMASLRDPKADAGRTLLLKDAAISTSGDAERYVVIDGKRYSHIVDPRTGLGVIDRAGVTVIARDGATADALATAVYVLGPDRGLKLVEFIPDAAACYIRQTPAGIRTRISASFPHTGDVPRGPEDSDSQEE
jgi:thiamine biosynthesis lipoprotein